MSPKEHFRRSTPQGRLCDRNVVFHSDLQRLVLCDNGIQAGDVSQSPGFFFVDLCHVVTDDLDLQADWMRFRWCNRMWGLTPFLMPFALREASLTTDRELIIKNRF